MTATRWCPSRDSGLELRRVHALRLLRSRPSGDRQGLATYKDDFYAGRPALTVNEFGAGKAYTLASNPDDRFLADFYGALDGELNLLRSVRRRPAHTASAPNSAPMARKYIFVMNFNDSPRGIDLGDTVYTDLLTGDSLTGVVTLAVYDVKVLTQ